jgi:hypothetical protein
MMRPIRLLAKLFVNEADADRSRQSMTGLLLGLSMHNKAWMQYYPSTPSLYDSGVVYKPEVTTEDWQDIPTTLLRGYGDCEDLACYRVGELQAQGIHALPFITWRPNPKGHGMIFHVLVRWPDGRIEDPSLARGMGGGPILAVPVFTGTAQEIS